MASSYHRRGALFPALLAAVAVAVTAAPEPPEAADPAPGAAPVEAPTSARDAALVERLRVHLVDGDVVWLEATGDRFPAVFRRTPRPVPLGGIVIQPGAGETVDRPPLLRHLAGVAADGGWAVLSVQPARPDDDPEQAAKDAVARWQAALEFLAGQGLENLVVVADARSGRTAFDAIAAAQPVVTGFVGLGAWDGSFASSDVAILSVIGTRDDIAMRTLPVRRRAGQDYPYVFETVVIDGADPRFYGYEDLAAQRIRGWLQRTAAGIAVQRDP